MVQGTLKSLRDPMGENRLPAPYRTGNREELLRSVEELNEVCLEPLAAIVRAAHGIGPVRKHKRPSGVTIVETSMKRHETFKLIPELCLPDVVDDLLGEMSGVGHLVAENRFEFDRGITV